jgi:hypothetical protein
MSGEPERFGFSLFCDDVRHEVGGKLSLMGLYQSDMVFQHGTAFPLLLPRFAIVIKYFEIHGKFNDTLSVEIYLPGDIEDKPSIVRPLERTNIVDTISKFPAPPDSDRLFGVTSPIIFTGLVIKEPGHIMVRIAMAENKMRIGSLLLREAGRDEIEKS